MDLSDKNTRAMLGYKLESQTNDEIDLKLLQTYLEATEKYGNTTVNIRYRALKLKYEALTTMPTMIEKTMSLAQLYASGSPLWAKGLNIEAIYLFAYLVPIMASENVPLTNYMDDYVRDCKNGMNASVARDRQMEKYGI